MFRPMGHRPFIDVDLLQVQQAMIRKPSVDSNSAAWEYLVRYIVKPDARGLVRSNTSF